MAKWLGLAVCLLGVNFQLSAQVDRATLVGTVTDKTGGVIPGAKLELLSAETGLRRLVETRANGIYGFSQIPIGVYSVTITQPGFRPVSVKDLRLGVGDNRTLDIQMEVSTAETTVTVEGVVAPLERESAVVGAVIESRQVREIPLNGRHWASLMALAPGAINTGDGSQQTIRFVGRARDDNNWTFDGVDATGVKDPRQEAALRLVISTDSIAEFRVNSTLYSAESGGGAGAQINVVSKSGSNEFHGSVFEFLRNDVFDARNPFDTSKQPFRLNQFGGNVGGPIVRNRTFFFANYEGLRQHVSLTRRADVPSAAFRARITDPALQRIINTYPAGNLRTSNAEIDQYEANTKDTWREDAGMFRLDHRFNDRNTFMARFNTDDGTTSGRRTPFEGDQTDQLFRPTNIVAQYQRIFSPFVVNEFKAGVNRSALNRFNFGVAPEQIAISGFQTLNNSTQAVETGTSYAVIDNLAVTRGRHTLKAGGEIRRAHVNVADPLTPNQSVTFASRPLFLTNSVDSVAVNSGNPVLGTRKWYYFAYFQDDFKLTPQLTLNLGLRYEFYGVNNEAHNRYRVFDINECRGFCPSGSPWYFRDANNFDPRVGIAWAPMTLSGKTVFRIGGGIYHGPGQIDDQNASLDNVAQNFSLTRLEVPNLSYPVTPYLGLARDIGITPRSLQRDRRDLYDAKWGFSIQQELPLQFLSQIGYLGSSGVNVTTRSDVNVLDPVTRLRPLPNFGRIDEKRNDGKSNFHALQLSLHRRVARGLLWATEYMWSHSINDNSVGGGEGVQIQNVRCRACDRDSSPQDIRHTFTTHWVYQLPFGPGHSRFNSGPASWILGGWDVSGIWTMRTGRVLTVTMNRSANDLPDGNSRSPRPDVVPGVSVYPAGGKTFAQWLNPAAFSTPASRVWGNAGRVIGFGPGLAQVDLSLQKRISLTERTKLVVRAEGFNIANRTQAGNPGTNWSAPASFGLINSGLNRTIGTGTSRQIQLALRLNF